MTVPGEISDWEDLHPDHAHYMKTVMRLPDEVIEPMYDDAAWTDRLDEAPLEADRLDAYFALLG